MTNETIPTIKDLKQCENSPETQKIVYAKANIDDLYAIIEGGRVRAKPIIIEWAKAEIRLRDENLENTRAKEQTKETKQQTNKLVIGTILAAIIGSLIMVYFIYQ